MSEFVVHSDKSGAAAKAVQDASVLAMVLKSAGRHIDAELGSFEEMPLEYVRKLVEYCIVLGNRWAA